MKTNTVNPIDTLAMALSGGLILLGVVILGIAEILAGKPYGAAPLTNDAGEVIATPAIDPALRTGLVIAGLIVLLLWGLYNLATKTGARTPTTERPEVTAD